MYTKSSLIKLHGKRTFAIVSNSQITILQDASKEEISLDRNQIENEIESSKTQPHKNQSPLSEITLIPTFNCNLRCLYCYAKGGETQETLPISKAMLFLDYIKDIEKRDTVKLCLVGGGEPLLNLDWVRTVGNYANRLYSTVKYHIISNGTFNREVLDWLLNQDLSINISYDGVMQGHQRPFSDGTSCADMVKNNIRSLVEKNVDLMVQNVVTKETIPFMRSSIDDILSLGVKTVKIEPAKMTGVSRRLGWKQPDPEEYAEALLNVIEYVSLKYPDVKIDTGYFSEPSEDVYCGVSGRNMILTPHGLLTACVEVSRPSDMYAQNIIYGKVWKQQGVAIDDNKLSALKRLDKEHEIGGCKQCRFRWFCHGGCPLTNIWENGFPYKKSNYSCRVTHSFIPRLLQMIVDDDRVVGVVSNEAYIC